MLPEPRPPRSSKRADRLCSSFPGLSSGKVKQTTLGVNGTAIISRGAAPCHVHRNTPCFDVIRFAAALEPATPSKYPLKYRVLGIVVARGLSLGLPHSMLRHAVAVGSRPTSA